MVKNNKILNKNLIFEIINITEQAAIAAAMLRGKGNEKLADQVAVNAMRQELNKLNIDGIIVIGEGERDKAPMLYIGENVGTKKGPKVDIALDPLEGTTLCSKAKDNSLSVIAIANEKTLLHAPDVYMNKIAICGKYKKNLIDLDLSITQNLQRLAIAKNCKISDLGVCILDRPRHKLLIAEIRKSGASIVMIDDGDIAGIIAVTNAIKTGIDIYIGVGGAPEGVLAAAALHCIGGQMQCRLITDDENQKIRATKMGIDNFYKKLSIEDMISGDVIFSATGVTNGNMLSGVRFEDNKIKTETIIMHSSSGMIRTINSEHYKLNRLILKNNKF